MEVGEPQRRLFTAIGTDDESYSVQMVGDPANGQIPVYDATEERWRPQSGSITSTIQVETALQAASFVDQDPPGLGITTQVTLGDVQSTPFFSVDALGNVTCLATDEYTLRSRVGLGREGVVGESQLYLRFLINGTPTAYSVVAILDNLRIEIPATFEGAFSLTAGDVLTFEMIRDTDGDNSGGLRAGIPDVVGWNPSPSVLLTITRFVTVG